MQVLHGHAGLVTALVTHRLVRKVAFTGGEDAGRAIAAAAADRLIPTVMELGGNDPAVFLSDAPFDDASLERLVMASFATAGQVCMAAKRLYVPRDRSGEFVEAYAAAAARVLGRRRPPRRRRHHGAGNQRRRPERRVRPGPAPTTPRPASSTWAARATATTAGGLLLGPLLVVDPVPDAALVREEQFAPVVPLVLYDTRSRSWRWPTTTTSGWARRCGAPTRSGRSRSRGAFEAGFTFVNTHNRTGMSLRAPFGGVKRSGWGREYAEEGLAEYVQTCVVHAPAAFRAGGAGLAPPRTRLTRRRTAPHRSRRRRGRGPGTRSPPSTPSRTPPPSRPR